jgi:DNA-binding NtrC family response regulator
MEIVIYKETDNIFFLDCIPEGKKETTFIACSSDELKQVMKQETELRILVFEFSNPEEDIVLLRDVLKENENLQCIVVLAEGLEKYVYDCAKLAVFSVYQSSIHPSLIQLDIETILNERLQLKREFSSDIEISMHYKLLKGCVSMTEELLEAISAFSKDNYLESVYNRYITEEKRTERTEITVSVLLIDDDIVLTDYMMQWVKSKKFSCVVAHNSEEAVQIIKSTHIDIVLLDIGMPKITGDKLIKTIKSLQETIRIIMLTAYKDEELLVSCLRDGAHDYVTKPFHSDELLRMMHRQTKLSELLQLPSFTLSNLIEKTYSVDGAVAKR